MFTIAKTWKQSMCPSTDEWIKKKKIYIYIHYIHTIEYYSVIKMKETLCFMIIWIDLEGIMLK